MGQEKEIQILQEGAVKKRIPDWCQHCGRRIVVLHDDKGYCTELCGMEGNKREKILKEEKQRAEKFRKQLSNFPPNILKEKK